MAPWDDSDDNDNGDYEDYGDYDGDDNGDDNDGDDDEKSTSVNVWVSSGLPAVVTSNGWEGAW